MQHSIIFTSGNHFTYYAFFSFIFFSQVKRISPTHPSLAVENARLKSAKLAYKARDKAIGKKMASKLFPENKITKVESGGETVAGSTSDSKVESNGTGTGEAVSVSKGSSEGQDQDSIGAGRESF